MAMKIRLSALCASLLFLSTVTEADTFRGRVVAIADGDTIKVLTDDRRQITLRLASIDAPEKRQAYGKAAKMALADRVYGRTVDVDAVKTEKWGRMLAYIRLDGDDVNRWMIRSGNAWAYRQYLGRTEYLKDEQLARLARVGLWQDPAPVPPWEFRH